MKSNQKREKKMEKEIGNNIVIFIFDWGVEYVACCLFQCKMMTKRKYMIEWLTKSIISSFFINLNGLNLLESVCMYVWMLDVSSFLLYPHLLNNNRAYKRKSSCVVNLASLKRWIFLFLGLNECHLLKCYHYPQFYPSYLFEPLVLGITYVQQSQNIMIIISLNIFMTVFFEHMSVRVYVVVLGDIANYVMKKS